VLVAKAIANLIPESNASKWQTALSESSPARCFQVDREILAEAHPWDCVLSALYESRVFRPKRRIGDPRKEPLRNWTILVERGVSQQVACAHSL
jgi:hypothetical protein